MAGSAGAAFHVDAAKVTAASAVYPKPPTFQPSYGTAGFRALAEHLPSTVFRCGLVTAARSLACGQACGLMITASHNPEPDNGVKIVEPDGGMLVAEWEPLATSIANVGSDVDVVSQLHSILKAHAPHAAGAQQPTVVLGHDTRPSAPALVAAARDGVIALGGAVIELGAVTTPQLHFQVVAVKSAVQAQDSASKQGAATLPTPSLDAYFDTLLGGYEQLVASFSAEARDRPPVELYVDCANGVGAQHLATASRWLTQRGRTGLKLNLLNTGGPQAGGLNHLCGADFVQKEVVVPRGWDSVPAHARCCSVDGDADRLVYFIPPPVPSTPPAAPHTALAPDSTRRAVTLLDGDKIAALAAGLLRDLVAGLPPQFRDAVKVGVVQTAYANGASTRYLTHTLGLPVLCTKTGVKHLHPAAHASFDIGIYFEANGHGTVLFSHTLLHQLREVRDTCLAARQLLAVSACVNQTVGDALSGILLVEAALRFRGWSLHDWASLYIDLPSRQRKLVVQDRAALVSADEAERRVCAPPGLQEAIDGLVAAAGDQARAFVRASGTEDAVRVYAEARTQDLADTLALQVAQAVHSLAGGVGPRPVV